MKKVTGIFIVAILFISACKQVSGDKAVEVTNENVTGVWKAEVFQTNMPNISEEEKKAGEAEFLSSTYTLGSDHSFSLHSNTFEAGAQGRWSLVPETKELTMSYEMGSEHGVEVYTVSALTAETMTLRIDIPSMEAYVELRLRKSGQ